MARGFAQAPGASVEVLDAASVVESEWGFRFVPRQSASITPPPPAARRLKYVAMA